MTDYRDIATPSRTKQILEAHGFSFKKSLGQNFLTEPNILRNIAAAADLTAADNVIEVGPGIGALTEHLARSAGKVLAFEIDQRLIPVLEETMAPYDNVTVINQDVLEADVTTTARQVFGESMSDVKVVANLPYYITTPIMMHLLLSDLPVSTMVVMMQKEVADRMTAKPNTKAYGSLSIAVQYYMQAQVAFIVPKTAFIPQPNVDSAIIKLTRRTTPVVEVVDEKFFFQLTRSAFAQRRKTLWNNLTSHFGKTDETKEWLQLSLDETEIDPKRRGETLSIEEFGRLANALLANKK
ncbi:16S rRNA (adenine(1518)-N(6)/adenine(1519)-N(6))-dimethyltransferase [Vagococcus penaei]|uniref:Ribosomal RNA small subunit methyltransferase A n=1 Tax=Vagococcus penaei TaxID=633807 RepID=A0A1Q2D561_9ENTE|nr:16S rRNA (adenine(1518)-N(6)/adenine(1519)-N(6))-dimethyltransferase RsmA [Vagococcus penaei]AQP53540.1 16S rRNA (adenine(1518)-N(6)/adenine(1519)-N(6))-dimethyltransferase [Vagococcus penaei]RSU07483.1 16S rRNA (adenine(1518)-N(6)/adenine(1519)-N(6))-dimethyltransferase [Vagococcus penaei]